MRSFIFRKIVKWWEGSDKYLMLIALGIAICIHFYAKNDMKENAKQHSEASVYLKEQGGSNASKKTNDCRTQKSDH